MEKKMHIAMLIGALTKGGAERVLVNLANYFVSRGYRVTMVTQYKRDNEYSLNPQVRRVLSDITEDETTKSRLINFVRRFRKLRGIWKKEKPDVILSFIGKNNIMAILTSRFLKIPVAVSVRAEPSEEYYNSILKFLAKHLFAKADGIILQTGRCFDFFPQKVQKKAVVLKNPINSSFFRERYEGERERTIVAVGRVDENKNHEMLIKAFSQIAEEYPDFKLIIYGEGELRESLLAKIKEMRLADRVFMPGSVDNVADVIYKSQIFVLPSNTEGAPNTLIEAMVMGLCVISTDCPCGGPADLITNGLNGILTPVGDVNKMKENLQNLLNNLQKTEELGKKANETADIFRPEIVYREWEEFLCSLVFKKRTGDMK